MDGDHNGYVDDITGWNFIGLNNKPWDEDSPKKASAYL